MEQKNDTATVMARLPEEKQRYVRRRRQRSVLHARGEQVYASGI